MEINLLTVQEVAKILKVSIKTLHRWGERGILIPHRTIGRHRRYSFDQIQRFRKEKGTKRITATSGIAARVTYFSKFLIPEKPLFNKIQEANHSIFRLSRSGDEDKKDFFSGMLEIIPRTFEIIDPAGKNYLIFFLSLLMFTFFIFLFQKLSLLP